MQKINKTQRSGDIAFEINLSELTPAVTLSDLSDIIFLIKPHEESEDVIIHKKLSLSEISATGENIVKALVTFTEVDEAKLLLKKTYFGAMFVKFSNQNFFSENVKENFHFTLEPAITPRNI